MRHAYTAFKSLVKLEGNFLTNARRGDIWHTHASLNRMNLSLDDMGVLSRINSFQQVRKQVDLNRVLRNALNKLQNKITEKQAIIQRKKHRQRSKVDLPTVL